MAIIFENIDTGDTIAIDRALEGKFYHSKLSAAINSSNLSINADRGQDMGWRLQPEQQAMIEEWEQEPSMIDKVSTFTRVPLDALSHADFLSYMLHQQELGQSEERSELAARRDNQLAYDARVAALKASEKPVVLRPFQAEADAPTPKAKK